MQSSGNLQGENRNIFRAGWISTLVYMVWVGLTLLRDRDVKAMPHNRLFFRLENIAPKPNLMTFETWVDRDCLPFRDAGQRWPLKPAKAHGVTWFCVCTGCLACCCM